jgi:hypothetical protein
MLAPSGFVFLPHTESYRKPFENSSLSKEHYFRQAWGHPNTRRLERGNPAKTEKQTDCKVAKNATEYKWAVKSSFRIAGLKLDGGEPSSHAARGEGT